MIETGPRYRVGDRVVYHPPGSLADFAGPYIIERVLPIAETGQQHYQIKSVRDGHERVVAEHELAPGAPPRPTKPRRQTRKGTRKA
jgi:hypothetical protein